MDYPQIDDLYLPNLAHEPLNHVIGRVAGALLDDASPEKAMGQALEEKRQAFETLIRKKAHPWGDSLKTIDQNVDRLWRGTRSQLKLSLEAPDEAVASAAAEIWPVFNDLPDPTRKAYAVEYGALSALLPKLEAFGTEKLKAAFAYCWVKALREAFEAFLARQGANSQLKASAELGQTQKAREAMLDCYDEICARINATMVLMPDEAHAQLIAQVNQILDEYRVSQKLSQKKKKDEA